MKLTTAQTTYIETEIKKTDIKYYEVYMEILDHMVMSVESILNTENIAIEDAFVRAKKEGFGNKGFTDLSRAKEKIEQKKINASNSKEFKSFFTFPKIALTLGVFLLYYFFIGLFENTKKATLISILILILIALSQMFYWYKTRKMEGYRMLKNKIYYLGFFSVTNWINFLGLISNDSESLHTVYIKLFFALCFSLSFISLLLFIKIRIKTTNELKTQIFI